MLVHTRRQPEILFGTAEPNVIIQVTIAVVSSSLAIRPVGFQS